MDDIDMITSINDWPRWPVLPLKRPRADFSMPEYAVLIDATPMDVDSGTEFNLFENVNLFDPSLATQLSSKEPDKTYLSAQAVVDDGWRVD